MSNNSYQTTLEEVSRNTELTFDKAMIKTARLDSQLILAHVLNKPRTWIMSHGEFILTSTQIKQIESFAKLRLANTPLSYILKQKEFYGRTFYIDKRVLVPRPESEQLITSVLKLLPKKPLSIIDLGCGSGVLGITAKLENPNWSVTLSDVSRQAIKVAEHNIKHFNLSSQISTIQCDLLPKSPSFDVLIANLPYVPDSLVKKPDISKEPKKALFAGKDGLDVYRQLFEQLRDSKYKPVYLFIESLPEQQTALINMAKSSNYHIIEQTNFTLSLKLI
jgi:release factor glutamine methyltransferase